MIDLNEALFFVRVVESGSMTAAAEQLAVQKSTVSRKITSLEERVGVKLLQRSTRKNVLTEIGERHFHRCKEIVQAFEEAENQLQRHKSEPAGPLKVIVPIEVGQTFFASFLGSFVQRWPKVSLDVELSNRAFEFREQGIDLALRMTPPKDPDLVCRKLRDYQCILVASPEYLAAHQVKHPDDLPSVNSITTRTTYIEGGWTFEKDSEKVEVRVKSNLGFNNITAVREAAISGAGVAVLPTMLVAEALVNKSLVQLLPEWSLPDRSIYVIYPPRRYMSLALSKLLEELYQAAQRYPNLSD